MHGNTSGRTALRRLLAVGAASLLASHAAAQDANVAPTERASPQDVEEVVVTGTQLERGKPPSLELISEVYRARRRGGWLYRRGRYKEAFPLLLTAAKRGFKFAQARVGFLYQQGCPPWGAEVREPCVWGGPDGKTNAAPAIGWLALAANAPTMPEIRGHFKRLWARIPESHQPRFTEVIATYKGRYGSRVNRVGCDRTRKAGTHLTSLTCRFMDEQIYTDDQMGDLIGEITAGISAVAGQGGEGG